MNGDALPEATRRTEGISIPLLLTHSAAHGGHAASNMYTSTLTSPIQILFYRVGIVQSFQKRISTVKTNFLGDEWW
jgi:hypothetical protein